VAVKSTNEIRAVKAAQATLYSMTSSISIKLLGFSRLTINQLRSITKVRGNSRYLPNCVLACSQVINRRLRDSFISGE